MTSKQRNYLFRLPAFLLMIFSISLMISCGGESKEKANDVPNDSLTKVKPKKKVMYSLPSPSDIASVLVDDPLLKFNPDIVNPSSNANKYSSDKIIAINLGIYTADLAYSSFFEQKEVSKSYFGVTKQMAEKLNIVNSMGEKHMKMMSDKKLDKKMMMKLINESFIETDAYLLKNDRQDIMTTIIVGGWLEAEYIATRFAEGSIKKNPELAKRIIEQGFIVELMTKVFEESKGDDKFLADLKLDISKIKKVYDKLYEAETEENFGELCELIKSIRNKYTV